VTQLDSLDALKDAYDTGELLRRLKSERAPKKDIALAKKVLAKKAVTDWLRTRARAASKAPVAVRRRSVQVRRTGVEQRLGVNFARSPGVLVGDVMPGPCTGLIFPGDRIIGVNGSSLGEANTVECRQLVEAALGTANLALELVSGVGPAPPPPPPPLAVVGWCGAVGVALRCCRQARRQNVELSPPRPYLCLPLRDRPRFIRTCVCAHCRSTQHLVSPGTMTLPCAAPSPNTTMPPRCHRDHDDTKMTL